MLGRSRDGCCREENEKMAQSQQAMWWCLLIGSAEARQSGRSPGCLGVGRRRNTDCVGSGSGRVVPATCDYVCLLLLQAVQIRSAQSNTRRRACGVAATIRTFAEAGDLFVNTASPWLLNFRRFGGAAVTLWGADRRASRL